MGGFVLLKTEITREKQFAEKGVILLDRLNRIRWINASAFSLLGWPQTPLKRRELKQMVKEEPFPKIVEMVTQLEKLNKNSIQEEVVIEKQNQTYPLWVEVRRFNTHKVVLFSSQKLSSSAELLSWGAMAQQLAHSIKNPLSAIYLNIQRIRQLIQREVGKKGLSYERYLNAISEEVERLKNATNAFMKFTDASRIVFQPCNLNELISQILSQLTLDEKKRIIFHPDLHLFPIEADQEMMRLALTNVILNAIEAIRSEGEVKIFTHSIERLESGRGELQRAVEVEIMDTGEGIPEDNLKEIFRPGFTTKAGGAGFGLSIAQHIISVHHGEIQIKSTPGTGTIAIITLPAK